MDWITNYYRASEQRTSENSLFRCFRYSNVRYSDPHCTNRTKIPNKKLPNASASLVKLLTILSTFVEMSVNVKSDNFNEYIDRNRFARTIFSLSKFEDFSIKAHVTSQSSMAWATDVTKRWSSTSKLATLKVSQKFNKRAYNLNLNNKLVHNSLIIEWSVIQAMGWIQLGLEFWTFD